MRHIKATEFSKADLKVDLEYLNAISLISKTFIKNLKGIEEYITEARDETFEQCNSLNEECIRTFIQNMVDATAPKNPCITSLFIFSFLPKIALSDQDLKYFNKISQHLGLIEYYLISPKIAPEYTIIYMPKGLEADIDGLRLRKLEIDLQDRSQKPNILASIIGLNIVSWSYLKNSKLKSLFRIKLQYQKNYSEATDIDTPWSLLEQSYSSKIIEKTTARDIRCSIQDNGGVIECVPQSQESIALIEVSLDSESCGALAIIKPGQREICLENFIEEIHKCCSQAYCLCLKPSNNKEIKLVLIPIGSLVKSQIFQ